MNKTAVASLAEAAWRRATVAMMTAVLGCALWFLCRFDAGDYMTYFALPFYAILGAVSVSARLLWSRSASEGRRHVYELTSAAVLAFATLDAFDSTSTRIELELCGPFILLGLWTVMFDEFFNLARKAIRPDREFQ